MFIDSYHELLEILLILLCQIINVGCVARTQIIFLSFHCRNGAYNAPYEDTFV